MVMGSYLQKQLPIENNTMIGIFSADDLRYSYP